MIGLLAVPEELSAAAEWYWKERGRQWIETLPRTVGEVCDRWSLQLRRTYPGASTAYVAEVALKDGSLAVLKVSYPEIVGEAEALAAYRGDGAVRCYAFDRDHHALLIERCQPGSTLRSLADEQELFAVAAMLMRRLWQTKCPSTIPTLREQCARRSTLGEAVLANIDDGDFDLGASFDVSPVVFDMGLFTDLAREGLFLLAGLSDSADRELLLHGDLHPRNIQRATREPWLAIDPSPLHGDPAYEPIPLITEAAAGERAPLCADQLIARVGIVGAHLQCSPARIAAWGVARRIDWALFCYARGDRNTAWRACTEARWFQSALAQYAND